MNSQVNTTIQEDHLSGALVQDNIPLVKSSDRNFYHNNSINDYDIRLADEFSAFLVCGSEYYLFRA